MNKVKITNTGSDTFEFSMGGVPMIVPGGKTILVVPEGGALATRSLAEQRKAGKAGDVDLAMEPVVIPSAEVLFDENEDLKAEVKKLKSEIAKAKKAAKAAPSDGGDPSAMPPTGLPS